MTIILITSNFPIYEDGIATSRTEFVTSHGHDTYTGKNIIVPQEHPKDLGGKFDEDLGEWIIP